MVCYHILAKTQKKFFFLIWKRMRSIIDCDGCLFLLQEIFWRKDWHIFCMAWLLHKHVDSGLCNWCGLLHLWSRHTYGQCTKVSRGTGYNTKYLYLSWLQYKPVLCTIPNTPVEWDKVLYCLRSVILVLCNSTKLTNCYLVVFVRR